MTHPEIARQALEHGLEVHGLRHVMKADGHDHASSAMAVAQGIMRWATPSGKVVEEGGYYDVEQRLVLATVRYDGAVRVLRFMARDFIVSEVKAHR